jgi:hypothetical protein
MELAARIRPRKYDSSSATGNVVGIRLKVEEAGSRDPCLERSANAGGQFGECGGGGVKYKDKSV